MQDVRKPISAARLRSIARRLLNATALCAISTVSSDGRAHINTAYFASSAAFEIVWLSGWAPHESQQKPLRPGSAKTRLADALRTTEMPAGEKAGD